MANLPFNISEWWDAKLEGDPSEESANFAWIHYMLLLAPQGSMALLLAINFMSSGSGGESEVRCALIKADLVECIVALPGQLNVGNITRYYCCAICNITPAIHEYAANNRNYTWLNG